MPADPGGVDSPVRCSRLYGDVHDIRVLGQAWLRAVHRDRSGLRQAEGAQRRRADPPCRVPGRCSEDKRCSGRPFAGEEQKYPSACWIRMLPPRRKAPGTGARLVLRSNGRVGPSSVASSPAAIIPFSRCSIERPATKSPVSARSNPPRSKSGCRNGWPRVPRMQHPSSPYRQS